MGGKDPPTPYLLDTRGNRIFKDQEKEEKHSEIWSNIFKATEEENRKYDREQERIVNRYNERHDLDPNPINMQIWID